MKCHWLPVATAWFPDEIEFEEWECVCSVERWSVKNPNLPFQHQCRDSIPFKSDGTNLEKAVHASFPLELDNKTFSAAPKRWSKHWFYHEEKHQQNLDGPHEPT